MTDDSNETSGSITGYADPTTQVFVVPEGQSETRTPMIVDAQQSFFQQMIEASKTLDIDKIKQLQEMYYDSQDRDAEKAFNADFVKMKPELPLVIKVNKNTQTNSKYAKLEDVNVKIDPILGRHGFGTSMEIVEQSKDGVRVRVDLIHSSGHTKSTTVYMPLDDSGIAGKVNKTPAHAHSSSIMYARRVGECALLNISTGDDRDGNGNQKDAGQQYITDDKAKEIESLLIEVDADVAKFFEFMGIEIDSESTNLEMIKTIKNCDLRKAMNMIEAKKSNLEKKKATATKEGKAP